MTSLTPDHVVGLVVGEGCFYVESAPDSKYRLGWRIRPAFCMELRHDDREALEGVSALLRCGSIYDLDFGRYEGYRDKGWQPHVKYRVTRLDDLAGKVVPFFRRHPLFGRKRIAFEVFAEIVEILARRDHRTAAGLEKAKRTAQRLRAHNARGSRAS